MKSEILELLKKIPFHPTGFLVLVLAGLIRLIYDGNYTFRVLVKSVVLLTLLGILISIMSSVFGWDLKFVVIIMACFGYLSGFLLSALTNVGRKIETETPNWFESVVEGVIRKKLDNIEFKKREHENRKENE